MVIWMTLRTSAGSKASRITLACHLLAPDLMRHSKPLLIPQSCAHWEGSWSSGQNRTDQGIL